MDIIDQINNKSYSLSSPRSRKPRSRGVEELSKYGFLSKDLFLEPNELAGLTVRPLPINLQQLVTIVDSYGDCLPSNTLMSTASPVFYDNINDYDKEFNRASFMLLNKEVLSLFKKEIAIKSDDLNLIGLDELYNHHNYNIVGLRMSNTVTLIEYSTLDDNLARLLLKDRFTSEDVDISQSCEDKSLVVLGVAQLHSMMLDHSYYRTFIPNQLCKNFLNISMKGLTYEVQSQE